MATKKTRTYSARDYEDMVKIELDDAIAAEEARLKSISGITEKEWESITTKVIEEQNKSASVTIKMLNGSKPVLLYKGVLYAKVGQRMGRHRYVDTLEKAKNGDIVIQVARLEAGKRAFIAGTIETLLKRGEDIRKATVLIHNLESKRSNYASLAARFRLGYTGDPADLDSINKKCREYLLKGEK